MCIVKRCILSISRCINNDNIIKNLFLKSSLFYGLVDTEFLSYSLYKDIDTNCFSILGLSSFLFSGYFLFPCDNKSDFLMLYMLIIKSLLKVCFIK